MQHYFSLIVSIHTYINKNVAKTTSALIYLQYLKSALKLILRVKRSFCEIVRPPLDKEVGIFFIRT
jgi:hypothetical protein